MTIDNATVPGWSGRCILIGLQKYSSAGNQQEIQFVSLINDTEVDFGDADGESVAMYKGCAWKDIPRTQWEVTFKGTAVNLGGESAANAESTGFLVPFMGTVYTVGLSAVDTVGTYPPVTWASCTIPGYDTAMPMQTWPVNPRDKYRVTLLWTDDTASNQAGGMVRIGKQCKRFVFSEGRITSCKPTYSDSFMEYDITIKGPVFDMAGNYNEMAQTATKDNAVTLWTLMTYSSVKKW